MYNFNQTANYIISIIDLVLILVILGEVICVGKKWLADKIVKTVEVV